MYAIIIINSIIFISLAILHVYWAFGGTWAIQSTLPSQQDGKTLFEPPALVILGVALGLWLFALATLGSLGIWNNWIDRTYIQYANLGIAIIFFLRSVGDFKYVGFLKSVKNTTFARNDTRIYSPLCLFIASLSFLISLE